jgi:hypothetical protein
MKTTTAPTPRWLVWTAVATTTVIVAFSGLGIFRWYIAPVDASLLKLPAQSWDLAHPNLPAERVPAERTPSEFPTGPSIQEKLRVLAADFQLIHKMSELPEVAKPLFKNWDDNRFGMADSGAPWEAGCVGDGSLPRERLILGGVSKNFAFVHYEYGGIGHGYRIEVYRVRPSGWQPAWTQYMPGTAHNMGQLRKLVAHS